MDTSLFPVPHSLVVQHNALLNARFDLTTTESRLFLALLSRVQKDDTSFSKCRVSVREIMGQTASNSIYDQVRKMLKDFAGRTLVIEKLGPDGRPVKKPSFIVIPLLAYAEYRDGEGVIEAQFNDLLRDYLLELSANFTKAQLTELLKLKSASSYRIYWLLREYHAFGKRTIRLDELKAILGLSQEYDRFNNFRARVLERAKAELAETDLPFTYETIKEGREVTQIRFLFKQVLSLAAIPVASETEWETSVIAAGVSVSSLPLIHARLAAGDYDEGYIRFVLTTIRAQAVAGKVKKEGGAVFKALSEGYLINDYNKAQQKPAGTKSVASSATLTKKRLKLQSELEDAYKSLEFVRAAPETVYNEVTRPVAEKAVIETITALQDQLENLLPSSSIPGQRQLW
jgi:hypothetical protein